MRTDAVATTALVLSAQAITWPMENIHISICVLWLIFFIYSPRAMVAFNEFNRIKRPISYNWMSALTTSVITRLQCNPLIGVIFGSDCTIVSSCHTGWFDAYGAVSCCSIAFWKLICTVPHFISWKLLKFLLKFSWLWRNKLKWTPFEFFASSPLLRISSWLHTFKGKCEKGGLFMSLVIHYWIADVQDSQCASIFQNVN